MLDELRPGGDDNRRETGITITILMNYSPISQPINPKTSTINLVFVFFLSFSHTLSCEPGTFSKQATSLSSSTHSGNPSTGKIRVFPPCDLSNLNPVGETCQPERKTEGVSISNNSLRVTFSRKTVHTNTDVMLFAFQHQNYFHRSSMRFNEAKSHTTMAH